MVMGPCNSRQAGVSKAGGLRMLERVKGGYDLFAHQVYVL